MQLSMRDWRLPILVGIGLVFARTSEGRLPYFLFYMSGSILLFAWISARHAIRKIDCSIQLETDRVEVGQRLGVRVRLDNDALFPLPWVEVDDATPQHLVKTDMPQQATSVPLLGSRLIQFHVTAKRRGHYPVGPIRVHMGDAFGFFQAVREYTSLRRITVYPRVHAIEGLPVPLSQPFGPVRTRERAFEDPSNQAEIRQYRPGDNPRHIHWKTSARMGELMTREYELNASTQVILFPDLSEEVQVSNGDLSTEETIVEITASLAHLGLRRKIEVGMVAYGQERYQIGSGRGQRAFQQALEVLARVEATGHLPIEQVLELEATHLSGRSTIVVMTPRLTPRLSDLLIRLRTKHQVMVVLLARETFGATEDQVATALTGLLLMRRVSVYLVSAGDDIRRLTDLRLTSSNPIHEGVKPWAAESTGHQPAINS